MNRKAVWRLYLIYYLPRSSGLLNWKLLKPILALLSLAAHLTAINRALYSLLGQETSAQMCVMWGYNRAAVSGHLASLCVASGGRVTLGNLPMEPLGDPAGQHPVPAQPLLGRESTRYCVPGQIHQCSSAGWPREDKESGCCTTNLQDLWAGGKTRGMNQ